MFEYPQSPAALPIVTTADPSSPDLPFANLAIDLVTGDLKLPIQIVRGVDAYAQRLRARLRFFKGEWFLDKRQGMPYFEAILVKNPDISLIQSIFRQAVLSTPGTQSIYRMDTRLVSVERKLVVDPLEIVLTSGVIFRAQPDEFIIAIPGSDHKAKL